ncbi:MAG: YCF48-related protein [Ignavibacteriaceae bacterium]|nr:YCF48-related protein [Ignavibacteriaceae bacterium]
MRKFLTLCILFYILSSPLNSQIATDWKYLNPLPSGITVNSVQYLNNNTWFYCGNNGYFAKTTDGGQTFTHKYDAGLPLPVQPEALNNNMDLHFFDETNGIMVGTGSVILKTTNGGTSWNPVPGNPLNTLVRNLQAIYFTDSQNGYISGSNGVILKTTDGGNSWSILSQSLVTTTISDIWSLDNQIVITSTQTGNVLRSSDGGATWASVSTGAGFVGFAVAGNSTMILTGGGNGRVRKSTDLGLTWTAANTGIAASAIIYDIEITENYIHVTGTGRTVYSSTNSGSNWSSRLIISELSHNILKLAASPSGDTILTVGNLGGNYALFGLNSTPAAFSSYQTLIAMEDVYMSGISKKIIFTGGYSFNPPHNLYMTHNGGVTWDKKQVTVNTGAILRSLDMLDSTFGYAGGTPGTLLRTTDGGQTWDSIPTQGLPLNANFEKIDFVSRDTGWVFISNSSQADGFVFRTNNGGVNWTRQVPEGSLINSPTYAGYMFNSDSGLISNNAGISRTTNGGADWFTTTPGSAFNSTFYDFQILPNGIGYGGGTNGKVIKTSDFGRTWHALSPSFSNLTFYTLEVPDPDNVFLFGQYGQVLHTTDGGTNWNSYRVGNLTSINASASYRDPATGNTEVIICGAGGMVMKLAYNLVPVELTSFTAELSGNDVTLNWSTATELNNMGFEIQRKSNFEEWSIIGFIAGNGTNPASASFSFTDPGVTPGRHSYRLRQVDFDGSFSYSSIAEVVTAMPGDYLLSENYPNPFNPATRIAYNLPSPAELNILVFNVTGELITKLFSGKQEAGFHEISFDAGNLPSGLYLLFFDANELEGGRSFTEIRKMMLLR